MSDATVPAAPVPALITPRHYQALCGLALAAIVLVQMQQSTQAAQVMLLVNLLTAFIGTVGILYRVRLSPAVILFTLAAPILVEQYYASHGVNPLARGERGIDASDLLLSVAVLTYLIGHYRLHGLWFGVLPSDARQPRQESRAGPPTARSEQSLGAGELISLTFTVPAFALSAEFANLLLRQSWSVIELTPPWRQLLMLVWAVLLFMFLAAHALRYWRRLGMDRATALLMLQDILWNETRREQRRIQRWMVWAKLRDKQEKRGQS